MMMAGQCTPIFFLKHQKENGRARSKEKMPGANLHMRVSSLKTGVFRICADWNRKSSTGSRHSPAFEVHFPAGSVWRRLRWRFRTPFASLSAGAALVRRVGNRKRNRAGIACPVFRSRDGGVWKTLWPPLERRFPPHTQSQRALRSAGMPR